MPHDGREAKSSNSKGFVTTGIFPVFIDPAQPSVKKQPFGSISDQKFNHTVELILPEVVHQAVWRGISEKLQPLRYDRIILSLSNLLEGDFFNEYIKSGNILMLSERQPGIDRSYSLTDGILTIELPKDDYERTGLVGKAISDNGRKHVKTRYAITFNLRMPSMVRGQSAFDKLVWACKNALPEPITWLFHDILSTSRDVSRSSARPIDIHHPVTIPILSTSRTIEDVLVPSLNAEFTVDSESTAFEIYEWLSMISLHSPRLLHSDAIDPYLSRYRVPGEETPAESTQLRTMTWKGLIPASWIKTLVIELNAALQHHESTASHFISLSAYAFGPSTADQSDGLVLLTLPKTSSGSVAKKEGRSFVLFKTRA